MAAKAVLAVGLDPAFAGEGDLGGLSPDLVRAFVVQQIDRLRDVGFETQACLLSPDAAGERMLLDALRGRRFDCVLVGAGLRKPPGLLWLLERVVDMVRREAPQAALCFNDSPEDTVTAVQRWVQP